MNHIRFQRGIIVENGRGRIVLDPRKPVPEGVVSHGHMDHLVEGALMTSETRDIMVVRKGTENAEVLNIGHRREWHGFDVSFHSAGHVLGSAMVEAGDVLYTGDFNPEGSFLSPPPGAVHGVDTLIMEATYGGRGFVFPPKRKIMDDIMGWMEVVGQEGPVVMGAYEFGKAQEIMNLGKKAGMKLLAPEEVCRLTDVYNKHGAGLECAILSGETPLEPGMLAVVPPSWLRTPKKTQNPHYDYIKDMRRAGGSVAFVSGWCVVYKYFRSMLIDAQFPMSDHADHDSLVSFVSDVGPREVLLVHTDKKVGARFADELEATVGCRASLLGKA